MATGAPAATVGAGVATLACAAGGDAAGFGFAAVPAACLAAAPVVGRGAGAGAAFGDGHFAAGALADFFGAGGAARVLLRAGAAAFRLGAAARTGALAAGFFFADLPLAGAAAREAGLAAGRPRAAVAAGFLEVFLAADVFTGSPRNGAATLGVKARREGTANFGRGGL